jgi:hypothetical protein
VTDHASHGIVAENLACYVAVDRTTVARSAIGLYSKNGATFVSYRDNPVGDNTNDVSGTITTGTFQ